MGTKVKKFEEFINEAKFNRESKKIMSKEAKEIIKFLEDELGITFDVYPQVTGRDWTYIIPIEFKKEFKNQKYNILAYDTENDINEETFIFYNDEDDEELDGNDRIIGALYTFDKNKLLKAIKKNWTFLNKK